MTKPLDATSSILNNSLQMLIFIYQKNLRGEAGGMGKNCKSDVCSREIQSVFNRSWHRAFPVQPSSAKNYIVCLSCDIQPCTHKLLVNTTES